MKSDDVLNNQLNDFAMRVRKAVAGDRVIIIVAGNNDDKAMQEQGDKLMFMAINSAREQTGSSIELQIASIQDLVRAGNTLLDGTGAALVMRDAEGKIHEPDVAVHSIFRSLKFPD